MTFSPLKHSLPFLSAFLLSLFIAWLASDFLQRTEARISDQEWQWIASDSKTERRIIIVDIDESSTAKYGAWPWKRSQIAELFQRIRILGAALKIVDIVFTSEQADDELLAAEIQQHPTVLSEILALNADDVTQAGTLISGKKMEKCKQQYPEANAYIANNATLSHSAKSAGHVTPRIDNDGVVRRLPVFICQNGSAYPVLALAALAAGIDSSADFIMQESNNWLQPKQTLRLKNLPEIAIPLSSAQDILLPWWLEREDLISISAMDILQGTIDPKLLQGAWVLIGSSAFGTGDTIPTPQTKLADGVEIHAQLLSALLDNKIPYQPQGEIYLQALLLIAITGFMLLLLPVKGRLAIYIPPLLGVCLAGLSLLIQALLLENFYLWISVSTLILYSVLLGFFLALKGYGDIYLENQRLFNNLSSYLPKHAAKWIASQEPINNLSAHHERVFVMYVDLRNFSSWCETLPAEEIGAILHSFYKTVTETIQEHGGQTEKYVGDAVMGIWRDNDQKMISAAEKLYQDIEHIFGEQENTYGLPPLALGIGIEYGNILAGSFGPAQRREYTVLGKAISVAIKLQEMTTELALPILIGENAALQWKNTATLESQGKFMMTGSPQGMEIFAPVQ